MAKKKQKKENFKNIKINVEELSITKIGKLETAEQSSLFLFFLFGILFAFIIFLPTILKLIKAPIEKPDYSLNDNSVEDKNENNNDNNNDVQTIFYTEWNKSTIMNLGENIQMKDFNLNGTLFSFHIFNNGKTSIDLSLQRYFLELYSEEGTLLERILLESYLSPNEDILFESTVASTTVKNLKKMSIVQKKIIDYPNILLEKNENQEEILECTNENNTITYKFSNEQLFAITHAVQYNSTTKNYESLFNDWKKTTEKLNSMTGIQSVFVDTGSSFVVNTILDLNIANLTNIENKFYYPKNTLAKIVKFEMNARGFQCK